MDQILQTTSNLLWPLMALVVAAAVLGAVLRHPRFKGWRGERRVQRMIREGLNPHEYVDLYNVTLPTEGGSTQIDHLIFSPYGVFVLETKNLKGWIFGTERQSEWTQKIHKNHSQKFQNPLRQNYLHTQTVQQLLQLSKEQVHSVVAFVGESEFKTEMPAHVLQGSDFVDYIRQFQQEIWGPEAMQEVIDRLEKLRLAPTRSTQQAHVAHVQQRTEEKAEKAQKAEKAGALENADPADMPARKKRVTAVQVPAASSAPVAEQEASVAPPPVAHRGATAEEVPIPQPAPVTAAAVPSKPRRQEVVASQGRAESVERGAVAAATKAVMEPPPQRALRAAPTPQQLADAPLLQADQSPSASAAARMESVAQPPAATPVALPVKPVKYCPQCQSTLRKLRLQRGPLAGQVIYRCSNTALCQYVQPLPDAEPAGA